jgi:hypothetical protein
LDGLGEKYEIGHAYFLKIENFIKRKITNNALNELFEHHLEPLLREYLRIHYADDEIDNKLKNFQAKFKLSPASK